MLNRELFHYTKSQISANQVTDLDIRLIISAALDIAWEDIYRNQTNTVSAPKLSKLDAFIARKNAGEPTLLITGWTEFYGYPIRVFPHVLIPRPETEQLVSICIQNIPLDTSLIHLIEVGTGSGCIISSISKELTKRAQGFKFKGFEISSEAYAATIFNLEHNLNMKAQSGRFVGPNFEVIIYNQAFDSALVNSKANILISNPPYLTESEYSQLDPSVAKYEPKEALLGGEDGLAVYRQIAKFIANNRKKPLLYLEIGPEIATDVLKLFTPFYPQVSIGKDLFGLERFLLGK